MKAPAYRVVFDSSDYVRSHGRGPSRTAMGTWAFRFSGDAYLADAKGLDEQGYLWARMATLAEAKAQVRAFVAGLPQPNVRTKVVTAWVQP